MSNLQAVACKIGTIIRDFKRPSVRTNVITTLLVLAVCTLSPVYVRADIRTYSIEAQPLDAALKAFALQANREIFFAPDLTRGKRTRGVTGSYDDLAALNAILSDTGLTFTVTQSNAILVKEVKAPTADTDAQTPGLRLAGTESESTKKDERDDAAAADKSAPPDDSATRIQEIVVTAQKRAERLQDVPVSVTAISAEGLVNSNQLQLRDYYTTIPGLSFSSGVRGEPFVVIRGLTSDPYTAQTVAITVDDVPYASNLGTPADIDPSDLAQIEILRGPQGPLYGASSIGGLLKFVTADPSTERVSGRVQTGFSSMSHGSDLGYSMRGSVNIPLSETFAVRASGFYRRNPGYVDNVRTGEEDINRADTYGGRLSALWRPSDVLSVKLSAMLQKNKERGYPYVSGLSSLEDLRQNTLAGTGTFERNPQAYAAVLTAKLGRAELKAVSGYTVDEWSNILDTSPLLGGTMQTLFGVSGASFVEDSRTKAFTQEVRLSIPLGERIEWRVGGFYSDSDYRTPTTFLAANPATGATVATWRTTFVRGGLEEYAAFSDITYRFSERFDVQFGGRLSETRGNIGPNAINGVFSPVSSSHGDNAFTYLVTPRMRISPQLMVYARAASGYRPGGGISNPAPTDLCVVFNYPCQVKPDIAYDYEVGIKGSTLNNMLSFDAALYRIDWKDIQIFVRSAQNPLIQYTANAGQAKSQGVELSLESRPFAGLKLAGWMALSDAALTEDFPSGPLYGRAGDRLPTSSRVSGNMSLDKEFPSTNRGTWFVGSTLRYIGDSIGRFTAGPLRQAYPSYTQVDVRAGVMHDTWRIDLSVNNAADKRVFIAGGVGNVIPTNFLPLTPRTIGLSVAKTF